MTESIKSEQKVNKAPKNVYRYEGKAIAKAGRELLSKSQEIVSKMSRLYKYQTGTGLLNSSCQFIYCIYDALDYVGFDDEKEKKIQRCLEYLRKTVIMVRIIKDLNQISTDVFENIVLQLVNLKTQLINWLNFVNKNKKAEEKTNDTVNK